MRITYGLLAFFAASSALTACTAAQSEATPATDAVAAATPAPIPAPAPSPSTPSSPPEVQTVVGKWTDWPLAKGDWVYRSDNRGSLALFGQPGSDALVIIRCDQARRQLFLSRSGAVPATGTKMTLLASSGKQSYPVQNSGGALPYAAISLTTTDMMMDRIIFSRGRFGIETPGLQPLALPTWPEFHRVVEDCRK
ncbi:hypothetical protein [Parasphingorhabdus sp.]